jgi:hypothetical protein
MPMLAEICTSRPDNANGLAKLASTLLATLSASRGFPQHIVAGQVPERIAD